MLGQLKDSKRRGKEKIHFVNGDRYEGEYKDDKKHGKGTYIWGPNTKGASNQYIGDWIDDMMTGEVVFIYASGSRYEYICPNITLQALLCSTCLKLVFL